jgi:hypothetical protein
MDSVKEAFYRVRQDIGSLNQEISQLKGEFKEIKERIDNFLTIYESKNKVSIPTNQQIIPTTPTQTPTDNTPFKPLKTQNIGISTGNDGVPTDRQTNQQTNQHIQNELKATKNTLETASEILNSLDKIKKEIRLQFKGVTEQEMLVFSMIYQISEETGFTDYKTIAKRLNLTESSIRDYVGKLIKKGIPVDKKKINNKTIHLSVSENLRKITSLSTIIRLREL